MTEMCVCEPAASTPSSLSKSTDAVLWTVRTITLYLLIHHLRQITATTITNNRDLLVRMSICRDSLLVCSLAQAEG